MQRLWPLAVIAAIFAVFGIFYASITPYRTAGILFNQRGEDGRPAPAKDIGAPDERQHANYVKHLMDGGGLMVLRPDDPELYENYQAHQPPLYYVVAAGWCKVFGAKLDQSDGGMPIRLLSILFGLGTVVGLFYVGFWATGKELVGFGTSAFALMPMFVALNSAASNDPLLFLLTSWSLAFMFKAVRNEANVKDWVILGVLIGLGILTKTTAVFLLPLAVLTAFLAKGDWKKWVIPCGVALLFAIPWWLRNYGIYHDPLAQNAFRASFTGTAQADMFIQGLGTAGYWLNMVGWWTLRSFIGAFGYMDIYLFESLGNAKSGSLYTALAFLLAIPLFAGIYQVFAVKAEDEETPNRKVGILAVTAILIIVALFYYFNKTYFQGQARYLYPAFGAFAVLFAVGIDFILAKRMKATWIVTAALLIVLNIVALNQLPESFARRKVVAMQFGNESLQPTINLLL